MDNFEKDCLGDIASGTDRVLTAAEQFEILVNADNHKETFKTLTLPEISIAAMKTLADSWARLGEYTDERRAFAEEFIRRQQEANK